jgi:molybdopterin-binding protein
MPVFKLSEAARLLGVSYDTVRRWSDAGRLALVADETGRLGVDGAELARVAVEVGERAGAQTGGQVASQSARNTFAGIVTKVIVDKVMAQIEIQAGPYRVVSLMSREACDELGLRPGVLAVAAVKATNVVVQLPENRDTV